MGAITVAGAVQKADAQKKAGRASAGAAGRQSTAAISQGVHKQAGFLAQADADRYNADTAFANKRIAERLSREATREGKISEQISRLDTKQQKGLQRVAQAASGSVVDEGSNLNLVQDTAVFGEFEARNIRASAARRAQGFLDRGFSFGRTGDLQLLQAEHAVSAGDIALRSGVASGENFAAAGEQALAAGKAQAAATMISAAGTVATKWAAAYSGPPETGGGATGAIDNTRWPLGPTEGGRGSTSTWGL
jgi:hypothetical protein